MQQKKNIKQHQQLDLFQLILSIMSEGVFLARVKDETIVYANTKFEKIFGYGPDELNGIKLAKLRSNPNVVKSIYETLDKLGEHVAEFQNIKKDGTIFWSRSHTIQFDHAVFGLVWVTVVEDLTLLREAEENIRKSLIKETQEDERTRISREIHDDLGQMLTIIKIDLFDLKNKITKDSISKNNLIIKMENYVDQIINKIQRITQDLRPSIIENYGLEEGIKYLVNEIKSHTEKIINLGINLEGSIVEPKIATVIFRILQEALTNILRHSHSDRVDISLIKIVNVYTLIVRDYDDSNLSLLQPIESNLGLIGMKERALSVGGEFLIWNEGGVHVKVNIPHEGL
ncbi:MAG: PAS domain S-box protein [Bacteriovorax sp.]|nr:PAS domain S-box protein [Bacteriovorax sp.]